MVERKYWVRTKGAKNWVPIYANSKKEAVLKHALQKRRNKNPFSDLISW